MTDAASLEAEVGRLRAELEAVRAERKDVEDHLRQFERAVEQSPASIVITDRDGNIEYVNAYFEQATGYTRAEALGKNPRILRSGMTTDDTYRELWAVISRGEEWRGEICNRRKDGELFWEAAAISGLKNDNGEVGHYIAVKDEITERKRAEERQSSLIFELHEARLAAERATAAKGEFLANMSHEIRTPMNGVIGMTGLILDTRLSGEQREFAETIRTSAEALLAILNDILDFSKIDSGKLDLETLDFDLRKEVESVAELLAGPAQTKGIELACSIGADVPLKLRGDSGRLRQILTNLTGNAIKFTEQGEVVVSVVAASEDDLHAELRFEVRDTGPGIAPHVQERLFQAFTQADASTTRRFGGTGLGLAISRQLVELMGGAIGITSEVGRGSTFWFTLPMEKQPADGGIAAEFDRGLAGVRALVVDDNATNRQITSHQLRSFRMHERSASSGPEALDMLREAAAAGAPFDLALLDMQMPEMDGMMLARAIEREPALTPTRRIMMTSLGQRPSDAELREAGIDAYLAKPIRQARLFDTLADVMSAARRDTAKHFTEGAPRESTAPIERPPTPVSGLRILLADDNSINQKVGLGQLRRLGYAAEAVGSGLEVLEALERSPYDVVLMDCQMPEMDGYEATRSIRRREAEALTRGSSRPRLHVIAMTAHAMEGDRAKCLAAGMDDYLSKPVQADALMKALGRVPSANDDSRQPKSEGPSTDEVQVVEEDSPADLERLRELADNDPGEMRALADLYLAQASGLMDELRAAARKGSSKEMERLAHQLGGTSATCGMTGVIAPMRELERSCGTGEAGPECESLLTDAARQLGRIREYLTDTNFADGLSQSRAQDLPTDGQGSAFALSQSVDEVAARVHPPEETS